MICPNGHNYDERLSAVCPYCAQGTQQAPQPQSIRQPQQPFYTPPPRQAGGMQCVCCGSGNVIMLSGAAIRDNRLTSAERLKKVRKKFNYFFCQDCQRFFPELSSAVSNTKSVRNCFVGYGVTAAVVLIVLISMISNSDNLAPSGMGWITGPIVAVICIINGVRYHKLVKDLEQNGYRADFYDDARNII